MQDYICRGRPAFNVQSMEYSALMLLHKNYPRMCIKRHQLSVVGLNLALELCGYCQIKGFI